MRYKTYCFGDLVEKWIDNRGKTPPLSENGIPLLEVKHLPESNLYPKIVGTKFVDKETYDSWFRAYLEPNDILFSTVGTTARVVMTPPTETVAIAQNILGIRFKKDLVDPWFMFYYMRGKQFQHDIEARLVTTVQASIKRADMVGIPIAVPQLDAQKELVHRVISLDHKIQLNQDINQTLEQMAQALFKSWFVDFEPVKAKIAVLEAGGSQEDATRAAMTAISGKDAHALAVFEREHPEQYAELKTTAELFPSAMQDSELGEIPVGWMVNSTSEHYSISIGKTPPRKEAQWFSINSEDLKWVSIKDMGIASTYISETSERLTHEAVKKFNIKVMPANTVFLSFKLTVGRVCITTEEMCSNEAIAHFTPKENKYESHWLYHALKSFNFNKLGSTSSIATAVNSKTIKEMKLIFPNKIIAKKFTKKVSSIMKLQQLNSEEIN
ncbi:restriction endonuclease subunit S, partial [Salmonella enterica subsp. enterica serovar Mbandaka]|nr:restriction endonuclease subunit S [Salmonella enterica subsp. enterica serovar Mbandaka]